MIASIFFIEALRVQRALNRVPAARPASLASQAPSRHAKNARIRAVGLPKP
jgi:hypothetical protein